ncbi:MAG: hypothetical protein AB7R89_21605 [Dehalococcoidia bacterium]
MLLTGAHDLQLLCDTSVRGRAFAAELSAPGISLLTPPTKTEREKRSRRLRRFNTDHRNRIEAGINTFKDHFALELHRAKTLHGLLTRLMAKLAALTLRAVWRHAGLDVD